MKVPHTWRELLGGLVSTDQGLQQLSQKLGVPPGVVVDWVQGISTPRPAQLYQLIIALPEQQNVLLPLLAREFELCGDSYAKCNMETSGHIPAAFYARVLNGSMMPPQPLRFWTLVQLILQQALYHLDPRRFGLNIILIRCMLPSRQGKVRSLREVYSLGTKPWNSVVNGPTPLLGSDSLAGYAVSGCCSVIIHAHSDHLLFPVQHREYAESQVAYPIIRGEQIAGCLVVASTQPAYFDSDQLSLIQQYADLLALAFETHEFYAPQNIDLQLLPAPEVQYPLLRTFRQRLNALLQKNGQYTCGIEQLELQLWQQFEDEFLRLAADALLAS